VWACFWVRFQDFTEESPIRNPRQGISLPVGWQSRAKLFVFQ
jgi:hypothetical protein